MNYRGLVAVAAISACILLSAHARAQTNVAASATAAPPSDDDGEPMKVEFAADGSCLVAVNPARGNEEDIGYARAACRDEMMPRRPALVVQTPGAFFVGGTFGKEKKFVFGPAFGLGAGASFPLRRPMLTYKGKGTGKRQFVYPSNASFVMDYLVSLNGSIASITADDKSDLGAIAGLYTGLQIGSSWWSSNERKDLLFALGLIAAYVTSDQTGKAFLLGVQPALLLKF